jgi:hypothetical protein
MISSASRASRGEAIDVDVLPVGGLLLGLYARRRSELANVPGSGVAIPSGDEDVFVAMSSGSGEDDVSVAISSSALFTHL